ncbi:MAG TPA: hypothetical protein VGG41_12980 [Solirubrobacteraceae bacterium]|jgi:tetratricopeptide (TPR) repeat protein
MSIPPNKLETELQRASALCDLGRYPEAASLLAAIVATNPESFSAWCLRSRAALGLRDHATALHAAKTAIALAPDAHWPHRLASIALASLGDHPAALWHAREAVRLAPHDWRAFTNLARRLAHQPQDRSEARDAAEHALEIAPHEVEAHMAAGAVAVADGRRADADLAFRRALAIDPQHSPAHNELARLQFKKSRFASPSGLAGAATGFATAVRADPRAETSRKNLDVVLRSFLSRTAYLIFLDAYLVSRLTTSSNAGAARFLAVAALAIPLLFAGRFMTSLNDVVRKRLRSVVLHDPKIRTAVACELLSAALLVVASGAPSSARTALVGVAAASALIGRLILWVQVDNHSRDARGLTARPILSTPILWLLATALVVAAAVIAYAAATARIPAAPGATVTAVLVVGSAAIVASILRRQRSSD